MSSAPAVPHHGIPVVDLRAGGAAERAALLDEVCSSVGFFVVHGHGIDPSLLDDARASALEFFDLPLAERMRNAMPTPGYPYGYGPVEGEALQRSLGDVARPDLKETFNIGPIDPPPRPLHEMDDPDERAVYSPNLWPAAPRSFRPVMERYYRSCSDLAATLMGELAVALGLPADWFAPSIDRHGSALRLAHYPALSGPVPSDAMRAGPHTDYGTLTILQVDGRPGLEVLVDGVWRPVDAGPGELVVNLGDLLARWTNDRWRSTMHRVVVADDRERRLSIPFFHNANWDARIECLTLDGEPARYPPTTAGHHLMQKFRSTVVGAP
jgi:isopenicillin N synthase-like dioxygenase